MKEKNTQRGKLKSLMVLREMKINCILSGLVWVRLNLNVWTFCLCSGTTRRSTKYILLNQQETGVKCEIFIK